MYRKYLDVLVSALLIVVLTVIGIFLLQASQTANSQVTALAQPSALNIQSDAPLQLRSLAEVSAKSKLSVSEVAKGLKIAGYQATFDNVSGRDVMALVINWRFEDSATGQPMRKTGSCAMRFSLNYNAPVLKAGEAKVVGQELIQYAPKVNAGIDLVILDDGTTYGPNACGELMKYQDTLVATRGVERGVLDMLEREGPEKVIRTLRSNLANPDKDNRLLNVKPYVRQ